MAIREFLLTEEVSAEETPARQRKKNNVIYSIEECDETAFVIRRETTRSSKFLVVIPTANQAYIKEEGRNVPLTSESYSKFMADAEDMIPLPECIWLDGLERGKAFGEELLGFMHAHPGIKYGLAFLKRERRYRSGGTLERLLDQHESLVKWISGYFTDALYNGNKKSTAKNIENCEYLPTDMEAYEMLLAYFGEDNVRKLIAGAFERGVALRTFMSYTFWNMLTALYRDDPNIPELHRFSYDRFVMEDIKKFLQEKRNNSSERFEFKAWSEYLFLMEREGYSSVNEFMNIWADSLQMQRTVYGEIREKYPENLASYHQRIMRKSNIIEQEIDAAKLADYYQRNKELEWENQKYLIKVPKTAEELAEEAIQQSNCLRSYIPRVADGETRIVFLRTKKLEDSSLVTIQLTNDGRIVQAKGYGNRRVTSEESNQIHEWAMKKKLVVSGY